MSNQKIDTKALLEKSRQAKKQPQSKALERKLENNAKFDKVNFNG